MCTSKDCRYLFHGNLENESTSSSLEDSDTNEIPALMELKGIISSSRDANQQLSAAKAIRKFTIHCTDDEIDELMESGVLAFLLDCLRSDVYSATQLEAAWILTNFTAGTSEQTQAVAESGAVPLLVDLLDSTDYSVCEQVAWTLGNIAAERSEYRDLVIRAGAVPKIVSLARSNIPLPFLRTLTWVIKKIIRDVPPPTVIISQITPVLSDLIRRTDSEIVRNACWAFSFIADGTDEMVQIVIDSGVIPRLIELLCHEKYKVQTAAFDAVGNIAAGSNFHRDILLDFDVLEHFLSLLEHPHDIIKKKALWTLANIMAGDEYHIQSIIDAGLVPMIVRYLASDDVDMQREAVWAVGNLADGGSEAQISFLVDQGAMTPLCKLLTANDYDILWIVLEVLDRIFETTGPLYVRL